MFCPLKSWEIMGFADVSEGPICTVRHQPAWSQWKLSSGWQEKHAGLGSPSASRAWITSKLSTPPRAVSAWLGAWASQLSLCISQHFL